MRAIPFDNTKEVIDMNVKTHEALIRLSQYLRKDSEVAQWIDLSNKADDMGLDVEIFDKTGGDLNPAVLCLFKDRSKGVAVSVFFNLQLQISGSPECTSISFKFHEGHTAVRDEHPRGFDLSSVYQWLGIPYTLFSSVRAGGSSIGNNPRVAPSAPTIDDTFTLDLDGIDEVLDWYLKARDAGTIEGESKLASRLSSKRVGARNE